MTFRVSRDWSPELGSERDLRGGAQEGAVVDVDSVESREVLGPERKGRGDESSHLKSIP